MPFSLRISVLAAAVVATNAFCPTYEWTQYRNMCYWVSNFTLNWRDVDHVCGGMFPGSTSVSIHDYELDTFLGVDLLNKQPTWIGLHRANLSSSWVWSDGSSFDYSFWYSGQPNYPGEACVILNQAPANWATWDDLDCDVMYYPFMCQIPWN